jgi:prepilin peptidase CpaA
VEKYLLICALGTATIGAVTDVRDRRIPNWLTYGGLAAALGVRCALLGWLGLRGGLVGLLLGGGIFFVLFLLGGMGGGDVKLMAAVGAWAGTAQSVAILIASAIVGGILAVCYIVFRRYLFRTLLNTVRLIGHHLSFGLQPHPSLNIRQPSSLRMPYGLAIALGTLYCVGITFWRG